MELNGDISLLIGCLKLGGSGLQGLHYLGVTTELGNTQGSGTVIRGKFLICSSSQEGVHHLDVTLLSGYDQGGSTTITPGLVQTIFSLNTSTREHCG